MCYLLPDMKTIHKYEHIHIHNNSLYVMREAGENREEKYLTTGMNKK